MPVLSVGIRLQPVAAHVEPHRRIEGHFLGQHQVRQFVGNFAASSGCGSSRPPCPSRDGVDHARDQLAHAGLALRRADLAMEILAGDDVGGGLRPVDRDFDVPLLEDGVPLSFPIEAVRGSHWISS